MSSTISPKDEVKFVLGPWLIGLTFELSLMGVLACQFVNYWTWYRDDKRSLRIAVAVLGLLNVLKSIHSFAAMWILLIENFEDLANVFALSTAAWWNSGAPVMVAVLDFYVQCYFCSRLWRLSKRWYVVAPIFILLAFALISMVIGTFYIVQGASFQITNWFAAHLISAFAGDFFLSVTIAYFLIQSNKDGSVLPQTVGLISALVRLTFQTAAPAALFTMFCLIFSQMNRAGNPLLGFTEIAFNQPLPKLYAISMMWTLNARRTIAASHRGLSGSTSERDGPSGGRRTQRRTNVRDSLLRKKIVLTDRLLISFAH
ncbi:hypothetical protein C8R43DRAFT_886612 [Mycena crocata]|nr:hypothetical protein C8R43DRAFT_886612 [Mycena crocata]